MIIEKLPKPYYWEKYRLVVTHDGFHENGLRIHIVDAGIEPAILDNALVIDDTVTLNELEHLVNNYSELPEYK